MSGHPGVGVGVGVCARAGAVGVTPRCGHANVVFDGGGDCDRR